MKIGNIFPVEISQSTSRGQLQQRKNNDFREFIFQFSMISFCHTGNKFFHYACAIKFAGSFDVFSSFYVVVDKSCDLSFNFGD